MAIKTKYGINSLRKDFPSNEACLEFIFDTLHSRKCSCGGTYSLLGKRRQFQCSKCRFQIAPTANTIFHKSSTPLMLWFHAIHVFSNAKSGISANYMERELEVTYKCAWRILHFIRKSLAQSKRKLSGDVEIDGAYFGGRKYAGKNNKNMGSAFRAKSSVMAAVERKGIMRAQVVPDMTAVSHGVFIKQNIDPKETRLLTDKSNKYVNTTLGMKREIVNHSKREFVRGDVHVNRVETFWSHVKRSITGTHKSISKEYFQTYLDGFVFHYNNRHNDRERFSLLLDTLLRA